MLFSTSDSQRRQGSQSSKTVVDGQSNFYKLQPPPKAHCVLPLIDQTFICLLAILISSSSIIKQASATASLHLLWKWWRRKEACTVAYCVQSSPCIHGCLVLSVAARLIIPSLSFVTKTTPTTTTTVLQQHSSIGPRVIYYYCIVLVCTCKHPVLAARATTTWTPMI